MKQKSILLKSLQRIVLYKDIFFYQKENVRKSAVEDYNWFLFQKDLAEKYFGRIDSIRILDVGCGQRFPFTLLFHSFGAKITGIDINIVCPGFSLKKYWKIFKKDGFERAVRSLLREAFFDRLYYEELKKVSKIPLKWNAIDLREIDVTDMPFLNCSFNLIVSNAVFEHIKDVPKATSELERVLKPNGMAFIGIHLFASLSGGHNLKWQDPDAMDSWSDVPPWDHLRGKKYPSLDYLNELREEEYRKIFEKKFEIVEWHKGKKEGEKFLSPEIMRELSDYRKEELLQRNVFIVLRKKSI